MKQLHKLGYSILILIGTIHIVFSFFNFKTLSLNALWFVGSGLAIIFAGLVNLIFLDNSVSKRSYNVCQITNLLLLTLIIMISVTMIMVPGAIGLAVAVTLLYTTRRIYRNSTKN